MNGFPCAEHATTEASAELDTADATRASLEPLFRPRSIAVVGASRRPGSVGHAVLANLVTGGFTGPVFAVNAHADVVFSMPAWRSLRDLPQAVDLAILVVPAEGILGVIADCRAAGVRAVVVLSAGFAETGPEGRALEEALADAVRAAGMRMVGPNCLGLLNTHAATAMNATFAATPVHAGCVAMSSQSGALGVVILEYAREFGLGFSSFVSVGNRAEVSTNDLLQFWETDEQTGLVLLYVESFGNPGHFARIARRVARRKPILAVKSGRSAAGQRAARSHTAALAGSEAGSDALLRQAGVLRMDTLEQMFEAASLLAQQPLPAGPRVAIVTNAGGPAILCTDACEGEGLQLSPLSAPTQAALAAFLPAAASTANPVDMLATAGAEAYARAVMLLLDDPDVDAVIAIHIPVQRAGIAAVAAAIREGRRASDSGRGKPLLTCMLSEFGGAEAAADAERAAAQGPVTPRHEVLPNFRFPESAARALGCASRYSAWRARPEGVVPDLPGIDVAAARAVCARALAQRGEGWLRPDEVHAVLGAFSIPRLPLRLCRSADEAASAARELGFPVAVKLASDTLVHKSEWRGVHLDLADESAVRAAFGAIGGALLQAGRGAELLGVTVQPMARPGLDTLIGLTRDPSVGPLVAFGLGGTAVELFNDVVFRITPVTDRDARDMLAGLRGHQLLEGWRGSPPADRDALADLLLRIARLADEVPGIAELDCNPVRVFAVGAGATALDARILVRAAPAEH